MLGIVVSRADDASRTIGEALREEADWTETTDDSVADGDGSGMVARTTGAVVREFDERHLDLGRPADAFDASLDILVFASKHAGETGPLLTAHHTGNFGPADHGGEPNAVARACPNAHARVLDSLAEYAPPGYDVGMECTHHGPTAVGAPSMFVELGSSPAQWADEAAARAVARAILDLREVPPDVPLADGDGMDPPGRRQIVGFGGGHYAPRFERLVRDTDWAVGHVAADWGLDALGDPTRRETREVIDAAFARSNASYGLLAADRSDLRDVIADLGYRVVGETFLRESTGVPLSLVHRLESEIRPIEAGLRFGDAADERPQETLPIELPARLLETASGIDPDGTLDAIAADAVAYTTEHGGTRPDSTVVLPGEDTRAAIVDRLASVLADRYDEVERDGDTLVARETVFDPDRAKTLGVPEGPKFGRLAGGEPVEVDGRTIPPETVRETRVDRFNCR